MSAPKISVVMPTYNKATYLRRSLSAWRHQHRSDYELLLLDDGSTDETQRVAAELATELPLRFVVAEHAGRSAARNRALEIARGSTVVFTDDDRLPGPGFLDAHVEARRKYDVVIGWQRGVAVELRSDVSFSYQQLAALTRLKPSWQPGPVTTSGVELLSADALRRDPTGAEALAFDDDWFSRFVEPVVADYGQDITRCGLAWMFGTTGNMSVPASLLAKVGGFDESLTGWGIEDTELHYRLAQAGASTYVCREAVNYHQNHPRNEADLMQQWVQNALRMYRKHPTLDVALYLRLTLSKLSLSEVDQILREARALEGSALLKNFESLQRSHVLQLAEARRDTQMWGSRR